MVCLEEQFPIFNWLNFSHQSNKQHFLFCRKSLKRFWETLLTRKISSSDKSMKWNFCSIFRENQRPKLLAAFGPSVEHFIFLYFNVEGLPNRAFDSIHWNGNVMCQTGKKLKIDLFCLDILFFTEIVRFFSIKNFNEQLCFRRRWFHFYIFFFWSCLRKLIGFNWWRSCLCMMILFIRTSLFPSFRLHSFQKNINGQLWNFLFFWNEKL